MDKVPARNDKEAYIEGLFSAVAGKYDLMNAVLSLTRHRAWRRFAVSKAGLKPGDSALDVCCGTGDFAFELARAVGDDGRVVGTDFSEAMLSLARAKAERRGMRQVEFVAANTCALPFDNDEFDCVTIGFGLRNLSDVDAGLAEMTRVLKRGGRLVCLETSEVRSRVLRLPWRFYFHILTPYAAVLMGAKKWAYEYLPASAKQFMSREELARRLERHGLRDLSVHDLMFGAVCVHAGVKPD